MGFDFSGLIQPPVTRKNPEHRNAIIRKDRVTRGAQQWEADVQSYRASGEGDRNSTLYTLALRGRSLELSGNYPEGHTVNVLTEASMSCGLPYDEAGRTIHSGRAGCELTYDMDKVWSGGGAGVPRVTSSIVTPSIVTSLRIEHLTQYVHNTCLPAHAKRVAYVYLAYARRHGFGWLKLSTRILADACGVSRQTISRYLHAHDKAGIIRLESGQGVNDDGKAVRTNKIHLGLDRYPAVALQRLSVDLSLYEEASEVMDATIRRRVTEERTKRREWCETHDTTTAESDPYAEAAAFLGGTR